MKLRDFPDGAPFKFTSGQGWSRDTCIAAGIATGVTVTGARGDKVGRVFVNLVEGKMYVIRDRGQNADVEAVQDKPASNPIFAGEPIKVNPAPRPSKERYYHIPIKGHPRVKYVTVYAKEIDGIWYSDVAYCAHGDNFSRAIGRAVARNRFQKNQNHGDGMGHGRWGSSRPKYESVVWWANHMARRNVK